MAPPAEGTGAATFGRLVADRRPALLGTALLLTGDRASAEELVQRALTRARRATDPAAAVRPALYRAATGRWSRLTRAEQVVESLPDPFAAPGTPTAAGRPGLADGLRDLPPRTRAVAVLRWHEQVDDAQAAAVLGLPVATVAAAAADALARLGPAVAADPYRRAGADEPVEQRLHAELGRLAAARGAWQLDTSAALDDVARRRRSGRRRLALGVVAAAAVLAAAVLVPGRAPAPTDPPVAAAPPSSAAPDLPREPVLVGPVRGSLAGDAAFVAAVREADWGGLEAPPVADRDVVLATDTPDGPVALVVGTVLEDFRGVWLTGPPGTPADRLVPRLPTGLGRDRPATLLVGGPGPATLVVVAGRGDAIAVSDRLMTGPRGTVGRSYEPVAAVDGVAVVPARTTALGPALSVRVTSGGREVYRSGTEWAGAGPGLPTPVPALTSLRGGTPDPHVVAAALTDVAAAVGVEPPALEPQLLWSAGLPREGGPGSVAVVVARSPGGALVVTTWVGGATGARACGTQTPPGATDVGTLTVARVCAVAPPALAGTTRGTSLVVTAPPEAVAAQVLDGRDRVVARLDLRAGGAVAPLPGGARTVRTLDAAGAALREVPVAPQATTPFGDYGDGPQR